MRLQHLTQFSQFNRKLDGKDTGSASCAWKGLAVEDWAGKKLLIDHSLLQGL